MAPSEEISMGDFALIGDDPGALAIVDAMVRLLPGAMPDPESAWADSFYEREIRAPSYTRPLALWEHAVPEVLLGRSQEDRRVAAAGGGAADERAAEAKLTRGVGSGRGLGADLTCLSRLVSAGRGAWLRQSSSMVVAAMLERRGEDVACYAARFRSVARRRRWDRRRQVAV